MIALGIIGTSPFNNEWVAGMSGAIITYLPIVLLAAVTVAIV